MTINRGNFTLDAAQAYLAAYLDEGTDGAKRVQKARQHMRGINQQSATGPEVDKARALGVTDYHHYRALKAGTPVTLDGGRVVAEGTHAELLETSQRYRDVLTPDAEVVG